MAQKTSWNGAALTESDINTYLMHEGGAWTSYTPTLSQGASTNIAKTITYSKYARSGRMITWTFRMTVTASGTAASNVILTIPVTAAVAEALTGAGGQVFDSSTTTSYTGIWQGVTTTTIAINGDWSAGNAWGAVPNLAIASGDVISGSITYEAAS